MSDRQKDIPDSRTNLERIAETPLPGILGICGIVIVLLSFLNITGTVNIGIVGGRSLLAGIGGFLIATAILLYLKPPLRWWLILLISLVIGYLLALVISLAFPTLAPTSISTPTCAPEDFNLIKSRCIPLPISDGGGKITAAMVEGKLEIAFTNGQGYTGVVFQCAQALNVQPFTHVAISGTANKSFDLRIEYKDAAATIIQCSNFYTFPATRMVSTIEIPLTYTGTIPIHEIAFMFYGNLAKSKITIAPICLSP